MTNNTNQIFWAKIEDILFLIETQIKTADRIAKKDAETSEKLHQIISDSYLNHPNNEKKQKDGRWVNYSALADRLGNFSESYTKGKDQQAIATENLVKTVELLKQFQDVILTAK